MTTPNDGGPAFPVMQYDGWTTSDSDTPRQFHSPVQEGMSLRDWFAGMALQGILASCPEGMRGQDLPPSVFEIWSETSYRAADAMLEAREK